MEAQYLPLITIQLYSNNVPLELPSIDSLSGLVCEVSQSAPGGGCTVSVALARAFAEAGRPFAWVSATESVFYAPDLAANGIDPATVPVVWARTPHDATRAAQWLLRSEAFGLVIIDLGDRPVIPDAALARLQHLARRSGSTVAVLTSKRDDDRSLGAIVALRLAVQSRYAADGTVSYTITVVKDKRGGLGTLYRGNLDAPLGMR